MAQGNIAEFNLTPQETQFRADFQGQDTLAQAGRRIDATYNQIGKDYDQAINAVGQPIAQAAEQHDYMTEVSQGSAAAAAILNTKTTEWHNAQAATDANDHSIQGTFLNDNLEPTLQQFQDSFTTEKGQDWALAQADRIRDHFATLTSADMMERAGNARFEDAKTTINQYGATIYKDPRSVDTVFSQVDATAKAFMDDPNIPQADKNKFNDFIYDQKNEMAKVAIKSYADKGDFAKAQAALNSGYFDAYIPPKEQGSLQGYIQEQIRQHQTQASINAQQQQDARQQQVQNKVSKVFGDASNTQDGNPAFPPNILTTFHADMNVPNQTKLDVERSIQNITNKTAVDDPATVNSFTQRFSNSKNPITQSDLLSAMAAGHMSLSTFNFFNSRLADTPDNVAEKTNLSNALQTAQKQIMVSARGVPPSQAQIDNQAKFMNWFIPTYTAAMKDPALQGMSVAAKSQMLLSPTDPKSLLSPDKIAPFLTSPQARLNSGIAALGPYKPGQDNTTDAAPKQNTLPPVAERVAGKTTYTNAAGVTAVWNGTGWSKR